MHISTNISQETLLDIVMGLFPTSQSQLTNFWKVIPNNLIQKSFFLKFIPKHPKIVIGSPFTADRDFGECVANTDARILIFMDIDLLLSNENLFKICQQILDIPSSNEVVQKRKLVNPSYSCVLIV